MSSREPSLPSPSTTNAPPSTLPCWAPSQAATRGSSARIAISAIAVRLSAGGRAVDQPEQHLEPDLELPGLGPAAGRVERVLQVAGALERSGRARPPALRRPGIGSKKSGASIASNRLVWRLRWPARRGAVPIRSATSASSRGLARNSENSCTPAGRLLTNSSKRANAASGSAWSASARSSRGISSVSSSRARASRVARTWP